MATFDMLLPVRNCAAYLHHAIDSVLAQSFRDWRLFVLDHGSADGSLDIAQRYAQADKRVQVHSCPDKKGISALLNYGIDLCDAKYLLRQDADDVSHPGRMQLMLDAFECDPGLVLAGSLGKIIDGAGKQIGKVDMPIGQDGIAAALFFRTPVVHPAVAVRLDALHAMGARYGVDFIRAVPEAQRIAVPELAEDYFLFGQIALLSKCRNMEQPLMDIRWHGENISDKRDVEQLAVALTISRFLADSFSALHGVPRFDPAPFCNHGARLFVFQSRASFDAQFDAMESAIRRVLPKSDALEKEMSFRRCLAERGSARMAARYASHVLRHQVNGTEWRTVKSWLSRKVKRRACLVVPEAASEQYPPVA